MTTLPAWRDLPVHVHNIQLLRHITCVSLHILPKRYAVPHQSLHRVHRMPSICSHLTITILSFNVTNRSLVLLMLSPLSTLMRPCRSPPVSAALWAARVDDSMNGGGWMKDVCV